MITIIELAKECKCDPTTVRKWIKSNKVDTFKNKAGNYKKTKAIMRDKADDFIKYWEEITTLPEGMITIPEVAKRNNVDRKTVRLWVSKNNITSNVIRSSKGPPTNTIKTEDAELFSKEYNQLNLITVQQILNEYNTDLRVIKRWAKANNKILIRKTSDLGGRRCWCVSQEDFSDLRKHLMVIKSEGFFYMIQPVPEFNENRIKLGFSKCFTNRMRQHKSICPNAKLIKKWKCKKEDEQSVIKKVTVSQCKQLFNDISNKRCSTEVFDCEDYRVVLERLEKHFNKKELL